MAQSFVEPCSRGAIDAEPTQLEHQTFAESAHIGAFTVGHAANQKDADGKLLFQFTPAFCWQYASGSI